MAAAVLAGALVLLVVKPQRRSIVSDDSTASSELGYAVAPTIRLDTASAAALPAKSEGERLVTRTWTNVRQSRSRIADVEVVLLPRDTVVADSLARGWYRVTLEGEVIGYAHRSTLRAPDN
jgi:hypothetical protein